MVIPHLNAVPDPNCPTVPDGRRNARNQRDGDARARRWNLRAGREHAGGGDLGGESASRASTLGHVRRRNDRPPRAGVGTCRKPVRHHAHPVQGGGPQLADALAGEFEVLSSNVGELQFQYVREGRLKALAVGAPARLDVLPGVPTLAEAGFPEANLASTFGLFAPGRTPPHVVARPNRAFDVALRDPELQRRLDRTGNVPTGGAAADLAAQIAREREASGNLAGGSARQAR